MEQVYFTGRGNTHTHTQFLSFFFFLNTHECVTDVQHIHTEEGSIIYYSAQTSNDRVNVGSDPPETSARGRGSELGVLAEFPFGCCRSASCSP